METTKRLTSGLRRPFQLQFQFDDARLVRKDETKVHEAVREALVNALIHADYSGQGGIVVEKLRDGFEFSNPGTLLVSINQLMNGNVSECRNKALQNMFMLMGAAEKAGSGVDKIVQGWASQNWRVPKIEEQMEPDRIILRMPMTSCLPVESLERLQRLFGAQYPAFNQDEILVLSTADVEKGVDNARMRQVSDLHPADMTKLLQKLVEKGALIRDGQKRWSRYRLPDSSNSMHSAVDSVHSATDSVHSAVDSIHSATDSVHSSGDIDSMHGEELRAMAAPARDKKRMPPNEMEQAILLLCKDRWLTRKQLAELLNRNPDGLRARFLTTLVAQGRLRLRHPDKPHRADQAYAATDAAKESDQQ